MSHDSVSRRDGAAKVTGRALYIDDLPFADLLHGKTIRTTVARGRLRGVRFLPGVPWEQFVVVTAADIPGRNVVALIEDDQPYLAHDRVRHVAEPVALIAHADKGLVEKAAGLVAIDVDPLPPVFTIDDSLAAAAAGVRNSADNGSALPRGATRRRPWRAPTSWSGAENSAQEQLYIEPHAGRWRPGRPAGLLQCPYHAQRWARWACRRRIRVTQA
jgi:CO/xanthine dehydrogenase Mo-binding subunit